MIQLNSFYLHKDGGLYKTLYIAASTVNLSEHVIYKHIYPFENAIWSRPIEEWTDDRFRALSDAEAFHYMKNEKQEELKLKIQASKKIRKNL